jgi:hypothetical protein
MRVVVLLVLLGCNSEMSDPDGGAIDGGGEIDAGRDIDAGREDDAGVSAGDGGMSDAGMTIDPDAGPPGEPCTEFEDGVEHGGVPLDELSGLAVSRRNVGLIYSHDDSGGAAAVYALDLDDAALRATLTLSGVSNVDMEDIAVGPGGDGTSWIYLGDTGDNDARGGGTGRASIVVYRFPEPMLPTTGTTSMMVTAEALRFVYPDRAHDCESVAVDPLTGDLYLMTKENDSPAAMYVARAPHAPGMRTLELVAPVALRFCVGMDMSPLGGGLLVRTGGANLYLFTRAAAESWATALGRTPIRVPVETEPQGEAVAWDLDGQGYWTASEGEGEPLYYYGATDPDCSPF